VAELPAYTGRALFIDQPSYMTTPYRDAKRRAAIAAAAAEGQALGAEDRRYLERLHRPLYLVTYRADRGGVLDRLSGLYGAPLLRHAFVAVFPLQTPSTGPPR
jgi:hypothetical protein